MADSDKVFSGSIPKLYDTYLVPMIFAAYAEDLADRVVAFSPKNVLETAAGSGVVTRILAARLDPAARYVVTDLNQPMLDHAATHPLVITIEDGLREGGCGSAISDLLSQQPDPPRVKILGVPLEYIPHGSADLILARLGLDADGIVDAIRSAQLS